MKKTILFSCLLLSFSTATTAHYLDDQFPTNSQAKIELGKFLMYDKILSGNKNISCATCHHPLTGLGDGLALPIGEGGQGLGIARNTGTGLHAVKERVPRHAPHLFNLGAKEFDILFYDGRVAKDATASSGFSTPAGDQLPNGLDNTLAAQAMFPVTSSTEMAGQRGENAIATAAASNLLGGENGVWDMIAKRLQAIPAYVSLFQKAYPDIKQASDISYVHAANAIGAFEGAVWRCTDSAYDRYMNKFLAGEDATVVASANVIKGAGLFYGKAECATCHSGHFMTDQKFHAIGVPQIGPGKGDNVDGRDDYGREQVTGNSEDRYKFRTPTLRQVVQTGPWGHDGAFDSLKGMVRHHLNAIESLNHYDKSQVKMPSRSDLDAIDFIAYDDTKRRDAIAQAIDSELNNIDLTEEEIDYLMDFLNALTDNNCIDLRHNVPKSLPSGLSLYD